MPSGSRRGAGEPAGVESHGMQSAECRVQNDPDRLAPSFCTLHSALYRLLPDQVDRAGLRVELRLQVERLFDEADGHHGASAVDEGGAVERDLLLVHAGDGAADLELDLG